MSYLSEELAEFILDLNYDNIPQEVIQKLKLQILDIIGISLASSKHDFGVAVYDAAKMLGGNSGSTIIGFPGEMPAALAVLVNGTLAHGLDYDDTHMEGAVHGGATTIPTALAVGEEVGADGASILTAIVGGLEVVARLGIAAKNGFHARGFHPTAICGALSSALISGRIYNMTKSAIARALGLAGTMASGLGEIADSWLKRMHPGWASHAGVFAALLSRNGFIGPMTILEGKQGLYASHLKGHHYDLEEITKGLGVEWETLNIGLKPYPCCHPINAFIDCAKRIRADHEISHEDIDEVLCKVSKPLLDLLFNGNPFHPSSEYSAQFSIPFVTATTLVYGTVNLRSFKSDRLNDPEVAELADKIRIDEDSESDYPKNYPGFVRVKTKDGSIYEWRERNNRGGRDNPLSREEVEEKYFKNVENVIPKESAERVRDMIERFECLENVRVLTKLMSKD